MKIIIILYKIISKNNYVKIKIVKINLFEIFLYSIYLPQNISQHFISNYRKKLYEKIHINL